MIEPLLPREAFVGLQDSVHLCAGGEAPWLKSHTGVYEEFARLKGAGEEGRELVLEKTEACRRRLAQLWAVPSDRVGFMSAANDGMNWLARGIEWKPGENVVTTNLEFPSVAYAWKNLQQQGVHVRMVSHEDWIVQEEDLLAAVDGNTRVLAVSQVSFYTGQRLDVERLRSGLKGKRALLALDATHASGVLGVPAESTDLCTSSAYKWMLATHGVAPCYVSERAEAESRQTQFGWRNLQVWPTQTAERHALVETKPMPYLLEPGNPAMLIVMFLDEALRVLLDIGMDRIEQHALDLAEEIGLRLQSDGWMLISPAHRHARSGNTCILVEKAKLLQEQLSRQGVLTWGDYDRLRVSGHLYNGSSDVDQLVESLRAAVNH